MIAGPVLATAICGVVVVLGATAIVLVAAAEVVLWRWEQRRERSHRVTRTRRGGGSDG
ncbi:hypothetical protein [Micrococcus lylae]|uniref:hypothetical protein n=1 Tax=Micrococcus lylae TaxID=1273 RepID=UPI0015E08DDF|nr:hypothetical protein [Micrococcus lylae]WIK82133.1 hypothetical protein CJ228_011195 [Micrococcus lylae]